MTYVRRKQLLIGAALAIAFGFAYIEKEPVVAESALPQVTTYKWGCRPTCYKHYGPEVKVESPQVAGYQWKCYPKKCHRDSPV